MRSTHLSVPANYSSNQIFRTYWIGLGAFLLLKGLGGVDALDCHKKPDSNSLQSLRLISGGGGNRTVFGSVDMDWIHHEGRAVRLLSPAQGPDLSMAPVWLLRNGSLDGVPTRDAAVPRFVPDVLVVLPNARPEPASGGASSNGIQVILLSQRSSEPIGCTWALSENLATAARKASCVHSQHGGLEMMETPRLDSPLLTRDGATPSLPGTLASRCHDASNRRRHRQSVVRSRSRAQ